MIRRWHHRGDVVFRTGGLVYDNKPSCAGKPQMRVIYIYVDIKR